MLQKYVPNPDHVVELEPIQLNENLSYENHPVQILDRRVQKLQSKEVKYVEVLWKNHEREVATQDLEEEMKRKYTYLFDNLSMLFHFEDKTSSKGVRI